MADLLFSLNAVAPLFLVMLLGFILRRRGFLNDAFVETGSKICFNVALPCLLFLNLLHSDLTKTFDLRLTILCVCGSVAAVALLRLAAPCFIRDKATSSAFIQVSFRSNYVLLGLPFINNIAGPPGIAMASTVLAFMIPTFNILAVLVLAENQVEGKSHPKLSRRIATNPLIIASVLGLLGSFTPFTLPQLIETPMTYISDMAMPLSLLTIGGSINFSGDRSKLRLAAVSSVIKLAVLPLTAVAISLYLGFDPLQMSVVLALFAGPPAVSCFPMALQMGADHQFTSMAVILSTALAAVTMFSFVFVLRVAGML